MPNVLVSKMECVPGLVGNVTGMLCNNYVYRVEDDNAYFYIIACVLAIIIIYTALKCNKPMKQELPRWYV